MSGQRITTHIIYSKSRTSGNSAETIMYDEKASRTSSTSAGTDTTVREEVRFYKERTISEDKSHRLDLDPRPSARNGGRDDRLLGFLHDDTRLEDRLIRRADGSYRPLTAEYRDRIRAESRDSERLFAVNDERKQEHVDRGRLERAVGTGGPGHHRRVIEVHEEVHFRTAWKH